MKKQHKEITTQESSFKNGEDSFLSCSTRLGRSSCEGTTGLLRLLEVLLIAMCCMNDTARILDP